MNPEAPPPERHGSSAATTPSHLFDGIRERHRLRFGERLPDSPIAHSALEDGSPWRGIGLGIIGVAMLSVVTPYADAYLQTSGLSATYLPTGVFLLFLLMLGLNVALRFLGAPLRQREVMLAYVTMLIPSAIPSEGLALRLVPLLVELHYYATPVNEWSILHVPHVPDWMTPQGKQVIDWFVVGKPLGKPIPWGAWIRPLTLWVLFAAGLYMIMISLTVALRKRWMDAERLQFPLAQVPLMVIGDDPAPSWASRFFRNPLLWIGMAAPFLFHTINGLNVYFPAVPSISLSDLTFGKLFAGSSFITDPPFYRWSGIRVNFYWSVIGISYLLRSEVSLSVWVFEWFYHIEDVIFEISGIGHGQHEWSPKHTFGYTLMQRYQRTGAMVVLTLLYLIASRGEIREMIRAAFGRRNKGGPPAAEQAIPWWSFWTFLVGVAIYFAWTGATGMKVSVAFLLLFFFLVLSITAARIIAATGLLWVYDFMVPMHGLSVVMGTARIDPRSFTMVGYVDFAALSNRMSFMPQVLDGMKITRQTGIRHSHFFLGMTLGIVVAVLVSFAMVLWMAYTYGGQNLEAWHFRSGGDWVFDRVAGFQRYHVFTHWPAMGSMVAGGAFMGLLLFLHRTYLWWPLYPLGFIIGGTVANGQIWFPVFVGWLIKHLVVRFSGATAYHRFKSVALGLVIGEFLCVGIWLVVDMISGTTLHRVFPVWAPS